MFSLGAGCTGPRSPSGAAQVIARIEDLPTDVPACGLGNPGHHLAVRYVVLDVLSGDESLRGSEIVVAHECGVGPLEAERGMPRPADWHGLWWNDVLELSIAPFQQAHGYPVIAAPAKHAGEMYSARSRRLVARGVTE